MPTVKINATKRSLSVARKLDNVWDVLIDDPEEAEDSQKRSDYLLLIQAKIYGWSGTNADRAKRLQISELTVTNLMNGKTKGLSLNQLKAITRKAGVTARLPSYRTSN